MNACHSSHSNAKAMSYHKGEQWLKELTSAGHLPSVMRASHFRKISKQSKYSGTTRLYFRLSSALGDQTKGHAPIFWRSTKTISHSSPFALWMVATATPLPLLISSYKHDNTHSRQISIFNFTIFEEKPVPCKGQNVFSTDKQSSNLWCFHNSAVIIADQWLPWLACSKCCQYLKPLVHRSLSKEWFSFNLWIARINLYDIHCSFIFSGRSNFVSSFETNQSNNQPTCLSYRLMWFMKSSRVLGPLKWAA